MDKKLLISHAQNCEDLFLYSLLKNTKKGFYVDVGANHPDSDSVTKFFYERGWTGINIEPGKAMFELLDKARPRDVNLNVGIAAKKGKLTLREYNDHRHGLSTFSKDIMEARPANETFNEHQVDVVSLASVFRKYAKKDIDFLKVDVEGFEDEVLVGNDWKRFRPKIILVENTPGKWPQFLSTVGYYEIFFDGLNRYYSRSDLVYNDYLTLQEYQKINVETIDRLLLIAKEQIEKFSKPSLKRLIKKYKN